MQRCVVPHRRIFGTEEDKQNCPFFLKIGACRHGDRCARAHLRPPVSQTILVPHLYVAQTGPDGLPIEDREGFEDFYRDVLQGEPDSRPISFQPPKCWRLPCVFAV